MIEPYTIEYYTDIEREEMPQAKAVARKIEEFYNPKSVIDLGCGTGMYLAQFKAPKRLGLDLSPIAFQFHPEENLMEVDLSIPQDYGKFDVGICFEVLEHIEEKFVETVVDNLCMSSDHLIISAAMPNQPGLNHVNCQPQSYWDEKFGRRGYKRNYLNEFWIVNEASLTPHTVWIIRNLMVYDLH